MLLLLLAALAVVWIAAAVVVAGLCRAAASGDRIRVVPPRDDLRPASRRDLPRALSA